MSTGHSRSNPSRTNIKVPPAVRLLYWYALWDQGRTKNPIFNSLEQLDKKLEALGIVEINGVMMYVAEEEPQNV